MREVVVNSIQELGNVASLLLKEFIDKKIWAFYGDLGAGKTTLIKKIIEKISGYEYASSPSFNIVNEYEINNKTFYHIDLYRIKNEKELLEIGFSDYLNTDAYCFIEWPEVAENFLSNYEIAKIYINLVDNYKRIISF